MHDGRGDGDTPATATILVAEDQAPSWRLARRLLERCGWRATWAPNGAEAVRLAQKTRFALVLTDCHMPDLDGYEAARAIRLHEGLTGARRTPIVAMTADTTADSRDQCVAAGMDDLIPKPLSATMLEDVLARWLAPPVELDQVRVAELRASFSEAELEDMLRDLAAEVSLHLRHIETALVGRDAETIAHAAHQIANAACLIGAGPLTRAARHLYQVAGAGAHASDSALDAASAAVRRRWEPTRAALPLRLPA